LERDLAIVWPRDERDQLKREKEIHTFAAANGWLATILDPGIRVTFRKVGFLNWSAQSFSAAHIAL
jgi:hypothetical protein